jgi:transposase
VNVNDTTYSPGTPEEYALLRGALEQLQAENQEKQSTITRLANEIQYLKHELAQLKRMIFGSKSERFIPEDKNQLSLDLGIEAQEPPAPETETLTITRTKQDEKKPGHARLAISANLTRVEHIIEPENIPEGSKKIGEEITEVLNYKPAELYVDQYIRPKYVLPQEQGIVIANLPSLPIPRGNAGAGLLSHLLISKYVDHLPFYRQVQIIKRLGVVLPESTINDWFRKSCDLLEILYERLVEKVKSSHYIQADETPVPVLSKEKEGSTHKGYHWLYYAVHEKLVCFDYQKGRGREGPLKFLENFSGGLQTDGYSAYDIFDHKKDIVHLACMAHARRHIENSLENDKDRAEAMMKLIQALYMTERKAREQGLDFGQRLVLRQNESAPVFKEIEEWLKENLTQVLPKSAIGQAIIYMTNQLPGLKRYLENGAWEIDNNLAENSIRPIALGRKNYMFAGSHEGAQRAAMMYSFLGTCKKNDVEPFAWLTDVLTKLPDTKKSELDSLLPQNWKK